MSVHGSGLTCAGCEAKLLTAHPDLAAWFRNSVKPYWPQAHVSWAFRDQASQEQAFAEGKTRAHWPKSAHNYELNGKPYAHALDLFVLNEQGQASWPMSFFQAVATNCKKIKAPIMWGGTFKTIGDADHFQWVVEEI